MIQVFEWMLSPPVEERLRRGLEQYATEYYAGELSDALKYLQAARQLYYKMKRSGSLQENSAF